MKLVKLMTKKTRAVLFFILIIFFLVAAPATVFYSWGYRFDFETKRIVQTGAFYFKVFPKSVQIYLTPIKRERILIKKTDFFFGAAYIENLLPKKYEVEIKKEGFHPWKKTLEIKEKAVIDAKNIVLVPENPEILILSKKIENFFFSPDEKKVILKEINEGGFALKLLELEKNVKSHLINQEDISKTELTEEAKVKKRTEFSSPTEISLLDLKFSPDSKRILLKINLNPVRNKFLNGVKGSWQYFLIDLEKIPLSLVPLDFLKKDVEDVVFHPENTQKLFLFKEGGIYEGDLIQKSISRALLENIISYQIFNKDIYYLVNSGFLFKTDFSFLSREKINRIPFLLEKEQRYKIYIFQNKIFLQDNQNLFLFNSDSNAFEKIFEMAKETKISPDFKKIVYFSNNEIWIFFLKEEFSQPQKFAGEKQFIARFSEKIGQVFWLTGHYLIFNSGNKIKIAEIDDRDRINVVDFMELEHPEIFWNKTYKRLFILSNNNLYGSRIPLP